MREIMQLSVGGCGCQVGAKLWDVLSEEHAVDLSGSFKGDQVNQLEGISIYFNESNTGKYVPRTMFADLDQDNINSIKLSQNGHLFDPSTLFGFGADAGNNWAKGHYTEGAEIVDILLHEIEHQVENCDSFQGFQITHALSGGTGSGLGTLLISKIRESYPDRILQTYTVHPGLNDDVVVSPYNTVLSIHQLVENADMVQIFDNYALNNLILRSLKPSQPTTSDWNYLISQVISGVSSTCRFPGQTTCDLRKIAMQLCWFPRQHFYIPSFGPLTSKASLNNKPPTNEEMINYLFHYSNSMCGVDNRNGKLIQGAIQFRGKTSALDAEQQIVKYMTDNSTYFSKSIPNNISSAYCDVAQKGINKSATLLQSNSSITKYYSQFTEQFTSMFRRKAYLHWYTGEGMDEMEFSEAEANLSDLISEYSNYSDEQEDEGQQQNEDDEEEAM